MTDGVTTQETANPENKATQSQDALSNKEMNFRRLESMRDQEREARIRAEMQAEHMRKELEEIKTMLRPKESDPLDEVEDYVDPARLRAKLDKERASYERKAKEIARETYESIEREREQKNYLQRLKSEFSDFDQVMNPDNLNILAQNHPAFVESVLNIPDEYTRRKIAYQYVKSAIPRSEERPSIKDKVEENKTNPYYIPPGSGTPTAVEFDIRSKNARNQAYEKLKQAQRRPIGNGSAHN